MEYYSYSHVSENEIGLEEVEIIYANGFFRNLFNLPQITETYVGSGTVWYDKSTGNRAGAFKESEILRIKMKIKLNIQPNKELYNEV